MSYNLSLHVLTDDSVADADLLTIIDAAVQGGASVIQVRAKTRPARDQLNLTARLADVIAGRAALIINDRLDVAYAARRAGITVDGVHLGQSDVPPDAARELLGRRALIGWTANTSEHLAAAHALPTGTIDYLGVGVIHPTSTKTDAPEPLGVRGFAAFAAATPLPCVAIGGITHADTAQLTAAGAAGIAVVSAVLAAPDPGEATRRFRVTLDATIPSLSQKNEVVK